MGGGGGVGVRQTESRGLFGKRAVAYDNPWAPGVTEKSLGDLWKMLRSSKDTGGSPTEREAEEDLPLAEVRCGRGGSGGWPDRRTGGREGEFTEVLVGGMPPVRLALSLSLSAPRKLSWANVYV